jgi:aerobic carbon-monoxide dehydrogenase large subunit
MAAVPKFVGERVKRREDPRLITGTATYVDDCDYPECCALILRSPHAHAKISSIDINAASKAPGVITVLTAAELKDEIGSLPCVAIVEHKPFHPVLARDKVRYVGEPIVVVVAADPYKAQDALDLVEVDYDPLEAVVDPEKALEPTAPLIHEEFGSNLVHRAEVSSPGVEEAMHRAERTIKFRIVNQRLAQSQSSLAAQWLNGTGHPSN